MDGRKVGRLVYKHMVAKFSRMDRFSRLWGSAQNTELSPSSNKISEKNVKKIRDLNGYKNEPAIQSGDDGHRML